LSNCPENQSRPHPTTEGHLARDLAAVCGNAAGEAHTLRRCGEPVANGTADHERHTGRHRGRSGGARCGAERGGQRVAARLGGEEEGSRYTRH